MAKREILVDGVPIDWGAQHTMASLDNSDDVWKWHILSESDPAYRIATQCAAELGIETDIFFTVIKNEEKPLEPVCGVRPLVFKDGSKAIQILVSEDFYSRLDDEQLKAFLGHELWHQLEPEDIKRPRQTIRMMNLGCEALPRGLYKREYTTLTLDRFKENLRVVHGSEIKADFVGARLASSEAMQRVLDTLVEGQDQDLDALGAMHPSDNERRVALMAREWALSNRGEVTAEVEEQIIEDVLGAR